MLDLYLAVGADYKFVRQHGKNFKLDSNVSWYFISIVFSSLEKYFSMILSYMTSLSYSKTKFFFAGPSPSAPASPSKSNTSISNISGNISGGMTSMTKGLFSKPGYNKDKCKCLLVVDDHHTDWFVFYSWSLNSLNLRSKGPSTLQLKLK